MSCHEYCGFSFFDTLGTNENTRGETNNDRSVLLKTLRSPSLNCICPIKLLLIVALRSGNLSGSIDEVLAQASQRADRTIVWNFPDNSVLPAHVPSVQTFMNWTKPAPSNQLTATLQEMALICGILVALVAHDLRRGAGRDVANMKLPPEVALGVADANVMGAMGHTRRSFALGITDDYVGSVEAAVYTHRAELMFQSRNQPLIGNPFKKRKLSPEEVTDYCEKNSLDATTASGRGKAYRAIHASEIQAWREAEKSGPALPRVTPTPPPPSKKKPLKTPDGNVEASSRESCHLNRNPQTPYCRLLFTSQRSHL